MRPTWIFKQMPQPRSFSLLLPNRKGLIRTPTINPAYVDRERDVEHGYQSQEAPFAFLLQLLAS